MKRTWISLFLLALILIVGALNLMNRASENRETPADSDWGGNTDRHSIRRQMDRNVSAKRNRLDSPQCTEYWRSMYQSYGGDKDGFFRHAKQIIRAGSENDVSYYSQVTALCSFLMKEDSGYWLKILGAEPVTSGYREAAIRELTIEIIRSGDLALLDTLGDDARDYFVSHFSAEIKVLSPGEIPTYLELLNRLGKLDLHAIIYAFRATIPDDGNALDAWTGETSGAAAKNGRVSPSSIANAQAIVLFEANPRFASGWLAKQKMELTPEMVASASDAWFKVSPRDGMEWASEFGSKTGDDVCIRIFKNTMMVDIKLASTLVESARSPQSRNDCIKLLVERLKRINSPDDAAIWERQLTEYNKH